MYTLDLENALGPFGVRWLVTCCLHSRHLTTVMENIGETVEMRKEGLVHFSHC